jgi:2-polyprenyl-3-methyl-5-hydroxy-6-metoxy-1,4-benzoquinol methylase
MSERQMAATLAEVREDHTLRYAFAIAELKRLGRLGHVIDAGCGVGYGSAMLSEAVQRVTSIEVSEEAHAWYLRHWQRQNIDFHRVDLLQFDAPKKVDAVVCFEFIEHVEFYQAAIEKFSQWSDCLIISTPNEEVRPHLQEPVNPFHFRHFRPRELQEVLEASGFGIESWHCQRSGGKPQLCEGTHGKFIIAVCTKHAASRQKCA